jgi:PHD/YefM family antitoxin component YafN of YafNO toxin-antitoxin module
MSVITLTSEDARLKWRETIDAAYVDKQPVVIERYKKPIVVLLNYAQWEKQQQRMMELELLLEVRRAKAAVARGEMGMTGHDDLMRQIMEQRQAKAHAEDPHYARLGD